MTESTGGAVFIGLMSGTSLDGVDGVAVRFSSTDAVTVLAHAHRPFPAALRNELLALNRASDNELQRLALAGNALARLYAEIVSDLLASASLPVTAVTAIGAHGQTVRHRPGEYDVTGFTWQVNSPALLAEKTGIDVIVDFRSRDVAAGGQGAPLVPAFHRAVFARPDHAVGVLNIGGISNLTALHADGRTLGFDCGPGNALMDLWCERHTGQTFDRDGAWGASGLVLPELLQHMRSDAYFSLAPPKSTGRDLFHTDWLARHLTVATHARPQDVQATLCELTASTCTDAMTAYAPDTQTLLVCGGGAWNLELMARMSAQLPQVQVTTTASAGLPPTQVEAVAFAWLAKAFTERRPGNLVSVTGAAGPRLLGALYPA